MTTTIPSKYAELADLAEKAERHECSAFGSSDDHYCANNDYWESPLLEPATIQSLLRDLVTLREAAKDVRAVIHYVENRCMAADGPVTPTAEEITDAELRRIYQTVSAALEATQ